MSFLKEVISRKRRQGCSDWPILKPKREFLKALVSDGIVIIAEVKKASPSAGNIKSVSAVEQAKRYELGKADAISVLTEGEYFQGSLDDMLCVSLEVNLPVMRKDFIVFEEEILQTLEFGGDSFLLISEALESHQDLEKLINFGRRVGMEPVVECFSSEGMEKILKTSAKIVGINSRDLHDLSLDLERGIKIYSYFKRYLEDKVVVAESGIKNKEDILRFVKMGVRRFLIGESLMRSENPEKLIQEFKKLS